MGGLQGKKVVVIGGSRGVGREIVRSAVAAGAEVLAAARDFQALDELASAHPEVRVLALDAARPGAPDAIFAAIAPDAIVVAAGAIPPTAPVSALDWPTFSRNWDVDVRISFAFCTAALTRPMAPGGQIIMVSSGAGLGGSPISGGYAGAKRMQMFLAGYCEREATGRRLDLRFTTVVPSRIMPETRIGKAAVAGYARLTGADPQAFVEQMPDRQSAADVGRVVADVLAGGHREHGPVLLVAGSGVSAGG
jgi:NAD(P)-dependent dehydrogenase (short-subunit alcohol dehydrogenase family)